MKNSPRRTLICLMMLTFSVIIVLSWPKLRQFNKTSDTAGVASRNDIATVVSINGHNREVRQSSASERQKFANQEIVKKLKLKWLELGGGNVNLSERNELAKETVNELLCSDELVELSLFLTDRGISIGDMFKLENGVRDVFETDKAQRARDMLVQMAANKKFASIVEDWSLYAGESCSPAEFGTFHEALSENSKMAANMALLGRNNLYVRENPEIALASSLGVLRETPLANIYISRQIENIPDSVDFAEFVKMLDTQRDTPRKIVDSMRRSMFERWARQDAHAAAEFAISHPDENSPDVLTEIGRYGIGGVAEDLEWIRSLPEGEYRDAGAQGAIWKYSTEKIEEVGKFIEIISNPVVRNQAQEVLNNRKREASNAGVEGE